MVWAREDYSCWCIYCGYSASAKNNYKIYRYKPKARLGDKRFKEREKEEIKEGDRQKRERKAKGSKRRENRKTEKRRR